MGRPESREPGEKKKETKRGSKNIAIQLRGASSNATRGIKRRLDREVARRGGKKKKADRMKCAPLKRYKAPRCLKAFHWKGKKKRGKEQKRNGHRKKKAWYASLSKTTEPRLACSSKAEKAGSGASNDWTSQDFDTYLKLLLG